MLDALVSTRGASQAPAALAEAWRVLAPGGLFISVSQLGKLDPLESRLRLFQEAGLPCPASMEVGSGARGIRCFAVQKPEKK